MVAHIQDATELLNGLKKKFSHPDPSDTSAQPALITPDAVKSAINIINEHLMTKGASHLQDWRGKEGETRLAFITAFVEQAKEAGMHRGNLGAAARILLQHIDNGVDINELKYRAGGITQQMVADSPPPKGSPEHVREQYKAGPVIKSVSFLNFAEGGPSGNMVLDVKETGGKSIQEIIEAAARTPVKQYLSHVDRLAQQSEAAAGAKKAKG